MDIDVAHVTGCHGDGECAGGETYVCAHYLLVSRAHYLFVSYVHDSGSPTVPCHTDNGICCHGNTDNATKVFLDPSALSGVWYSTISHLLQGVGGREGVGWRVM